MESDETCKAEGNPAERLVCQEQYGSTERRHDFVVRHDKELEKIDTSSPYSSLTQVFRSVFLPHGYPESVSEDYLPYQVWDTAQAFMSSFTGSLAAHAVLKGAGVGDESATVLAATITWLLKDGAGMVGRIVFTWAKGTGLDCDAKRWRLFADFLNDFAYSLDLISPSCGDYFTAIACFSGICRSIVGVAGRATRAALTQHQARRNNLADVFAKDGSQETMVNLTGLVCSLMLVPLVSENQTLTWCVFVLFACLHILANYKAVTSVCMESINQTRLHYIVRHFLSHKEVPTVKETNFKEPVFLPVKRSLKVHLGASLDDITKCGVPFPVLKTVYSNKANGYLLGVNFKKGAVFIVLGQTSDSLDQLRACFHAELLNYMVECSITGQKPPADLETLFKSVQDCLLAEEIDTDLLCSVLKSSLHLTESSMNSLTQGLHEKGWVTETSLLGADEWRASWDFNQLTDKKEQ